MERYHIYKLGLAILFYAVYFARQTVVNGLKIDDVTSTTNTTDYRERRDSGDDNAVFYQGADGTPGVDFPTWSYVPRTKFSCREMEAGYYADLETDCQVFHICDEGRKLSFLCPNGTTFQQSELICDWWFKVNCSNSPSLYEESAEVLQRENAKRKDSRRLSYHGTKQGVFSSKEDYDHGHDTFGGTPAHLVTPSYRASVKTIDNRIIATTEGSARKNYNTRGDRTLDSFGNGVRERNYDKTNQFSTGHGQNTYDINVQVKPGQREQTGFSTSFQQKASTVAPFSFNRASQSTRSDNIGTNGYKQKFSFDRSSQQNERGGDQNTFGANLQNKFNTQVTSGIGAQVKPNGFIGQVSLDSNSQRTATERHQNTFGSNVQNGFNVHSQGNSEIGKQATFNAGRQQQGDNNVFFRSSTETSSGRQNQNTFRNSFGVHKNTNTELTAFGTDIQHGVDDNAGLTSFGDSSQYNAGEHGQSTFGARLQGGISQSGQTGFGVNLHGKTNTVEQVTFGSNTQQKTDSFSIPVDRNSQRTQGYDQNIFGRFGTHQVSAESSSNIPLDRTAQRTGGHDRNQFGRVTHATTTQLPLDRSSQRKNGRDQNIFGRGQITFGTNTQQTVGSSVSQFPSGRNSQKVNEFDQNIFTSGKSTSDIDTQQRFGQIPLDGNLQNTNIRDQNQHGRGQVTFGTSTQQATGGSAGQLTIDASSQKISDQGRNTFGSGKVTFGANTQQTVGSSVSQFPSGRNSQKVNEFDQNIFTSGKSTSDTDTQQRFGQIPLHGNLQNTNIRDQDQHGRGQVTFGSSTQQATGGSAGQLDATSQKISGQGRNTFGNGQVTFGTNTQQTFGSSPGKISLDVTSQKLNGRDQNRFDTSLQEKIPSIEHNAFVGQESTSQFGTGLTSSRINGGSDKIKFSISSQGKSDEFDSSKQQNGNGYQQNIFGGNGQNKLTERGQTTVSRDSHITFGGTGQNRFDVNLQGKHEQFEQTTSNFGLKTGDTTQSGYSFGSHKEEVDDAGKIPVLIVSAETQEPQESASFVKSGRNNLLDNNRQATTTNPYPNHKTTYTDIKDPRQYYQQPQSKLPEKPFYGSSVSPQVLSTVPVSSPEGSLRTTTEVNSQKETISSRYGFRTDISTTEQPSVDANALTSGRSDSIVSTTFTPFSNTEQFTTGKSPVTTNRFSFGVNEPQTTKSSVGFNSGTEQIEVSTSRAINSFGQTTLPTTTRFATIGSNKVDVTTHDRGYTNGADVRFNSISSTLSPDDIEGRSTTDYPDSQRNNNYDGKFSSSSEGNGRFGFSSTGSTEKPYSNNSPIIKLNIRPSTISPQFESNTRFGKAFNADSPKIQVITLDGARTKDFGAGPIEVTGNDRTKFKISFGSGQPGQFISSGQTVSPGTIKIKTNGISTNGNSFRVITGVNITPSISFNKYGGTTKGVGISSRTTASEYEKNFISSTPSSKESSLNDETVGININSSPRDSFGVTRGNFDGLSTEENVKSTSTRATPTEKETVEFTINDEIFTSPAPTSTERINLTINDEIHSAPASDYSVRGQGGIGNTVTTATPDDAIYTSPTSILQPKPFSASTDTRFGSAQTGYTDKSLLETTGTSQLPPYTVSSASPFITTYKPSAGLGPKTPTPTLPTPFSTESTSLYSYNPTDENINNVINTLMGVVKQRFGDKEIGFGTPRPGLVVPPSAGPQTLHSLAIYFANALDNLTSSSHREHTEETDDESGTDSPIIHIDNEELIKSLLTQMTRSNYDHLFKEKEKDATTTELPFSVRSGADDNENDLIREDTKYPATTEGPGVRQLARVFTEALSAYLEDPDTFKKVLHDVRPTEPPQLSSRSETTETDEDEVLNYSDSDLKSDHPHLPARPTGIPVSPTWGYILAFNKSSPGPDNLESHNSLSSDNENLLSADTQSFISQLNKVSQAFKTTLALDGNKGTTEASDPTGFTNDDAKSLPDNHWTTSSDVTKLWQTTLSINPALLNENFDSSQTGQGFTSPDVDTRFSTVTGSEDNSSESSSDAAETTRVSEIQYELRSLPKIDLNSTQVHGILIDFMNATKTEGSGKLQRILHKLNISQGEFLDKMKEIEGNPLTRRLILLLISECNTDKNKELDTRAVSSDSVFGLAETKLHSDNTEQLAVTSRATRSDGEVSITESSSLKHIVHPSLDDEDEDTRALELLNSLYVIASKFGK